MADRSRRRIRVADPIALVGLIVFLAFSFRAYTTGLDMPPLIASICTACLTGPLIQRGAEKVYDKLGNGKDS